MEIERKAGIASSLFEQRAMSHSASRSLWRKSTGNVSARSRIRSRYRGRDYGAARLKEIDSARKKNSSDHAKKWFQVAVWPGRSRSLRSRPAKARLQKREAGNQTEPEPLPGEVHLSEQTPPEIDGSQKERARLGGGLPASVAPQHFLALSIVAGLDLSSSPVCQGSAAASA
jgi:hypothetical protein